VVDEGLKLTSVSGDTIKSLAESISLAANAAIQIAASSQQQLEGMDQVVVAMENIKEASMQSAASTQQSADSVTELQKLGEKLKSLMTQYKL
jgi:methyl-accepting chemotaxis protein